MKERIRWEMNFQELYLILKLIRTVRNNFFQLKASDVNSFRYMYYYLFYIFIKYDAYYTYIYELILLKGSILNAAIF